MDFIVLILEILVDKSHKSYTIALPPMLPMLIGPARFNPCRAGHCIYSMFPLLHGIKPAVFSLSRAKLPQDLPESIRES